MKFYFTWRLLFIFFTVASTTMLHAQTALRPIRYVKIEGGIEIDSQRFSYSDGRGGQVPYVNMWPEYRHLMVLYNCGQFDQINIDFDTAELFYFRSNPYRYSNSYDSHSRLIGQLMDTGSSYSHELLTTISGIGTAITTEQTNKWDISTASWLPFERTIKNYNAAGKITDVLDQTYSGSIWTDNYHETYTYSGQNKLIAYGGRIFQNVSRGIDSISYLLYYSPAGDLDSILSLDRQINFSQPFWNTSRFKFYYNSTHDPVIVESHAGRNLDFRDSSVYDSQHRRVYVYQSWDSMGKQIPVAEITVNYFGTQVHEISTKALSDPSFHYYVSDSYERYDYEQYVPASVAFLNTNRGCNVYPVPANNFINVEASFSKATMVQCEIVDMSGRCIRRWEVPFSDHFKTIVPVSDLSTGTYSLRINGNAESHTKRFIIAR